jgi:2-iminobutanoate/2-iminopropanoate deaminase
MDMPKTIYTDKAPTPKGHYSQATEYGGLVYCSGILAIKPGCGTAVGGTIEEEAKQVFENFAAVLEAAGTTRERTLKVTVFISDISLWDKVNEMYSRFFAEHKPARSIVPVKQLHFGLNLEMEAIVAK